MSSRPLTAAALLAALLAAAPAPAAEQTYTIDNAHSSVGFSIRHFVSRVPGRFRTFSGTIVLDRDNPAAARVSVKIDAASIDTAEPRRDEHLRSPDFFDVEKHPEITFESTGVRVHAPDRVTLDGNLTMHGVTKPVSLEVTGLGFSPGPRPGSRMAGFEAKATLNRKEFGIIWNRVLDAGGLALGEDVDVHIFVEAGYTEPQPEEKPAPVAAAED